MASADPILFVGWVSFASLAAFAACVWDKRRAVRSQRRIPEATLLGLAVVGGTPGLVVGMALARHKARKAAFLLPLAAIAALQAAVAWLFLQA